MMRQPMLPVKQQMAWRLKQIQPISLALSMAMMVGLTALSVSQLQAQEVSTRWEQPVILFDASSSASAANPRILFYPLVVVDTEQHLKVLWSVAVDGAGDSQGLFNGLYCMDGNGSDWSSPVDVITDPNGARVDWPQHAMDSYGRLHVVWTGSNARLFLSRVPSAEACDARLWETFVLPTADQVLHGDIEVDAEGILHVAYAARGKDVYYMRSLDDGLSWTDPVAISTVQPTVATSFPSLAVDADGRIHIVWEQNQLPNGVPSLGLFYASSQDDGLSWSVPSIFSQVDGEYTQPNLAALDDGSIHRLWNGRASTRGRYHQWSQDGGSTWSPTEEFISKGFGGGQTGFPRFSVDSRGDLHLVSGTDAVTYVVWNGERWISRPMNIAGYLEYPNITIERGHILHAVASDFQRIWYVRGQTDAPEVMTEFQALPAPPARAVTPGETATPPATATPQPTATPPALQQVGPPPESGLFTPILLSSALAFAVVAVVVVASIGRRRS